MPARCRNLRKCCNFTISAIVNNRALDFRRRIKCRWSLRRSADIFGAVLLFKSWQHSSKLAKAWSSLSTICLANDTSGKSLWTTLYFGRLLGLSWMAALDSLLDFLDSKLMGWDSSRFCTYLEPKMLELLSPVLPPPWWCWGPREVLWDLREVLRLSPDEGPVPGCPLPPGCEGPWIWAYTCWRGCLA